MLEVLRDINLERVLLSSLMEDDSAILVVGDMLAPHYFSEEPHGFIYGVIKELEERGLKTNQEMVSVELAKKDAQALGVLKLVIATAPQTDYEKLSDDLIEYYRKRELFKISMKMQSMLENMNSVYVVKEVEKELALLDVAAVTRGKTYKERKEELSKLPPLPKYQTGVKFVDDSLTGGITAGQLILVMGDPEAGKTILTTQILRNISQGFLTLFFCFEFTVRQFIEVNEKRKKEWNPENLILIDDGYALGDVEREVKVWAKRGCKFVVIDSQMRVDNSANNGTVEQMESEKFSKLAKLCHRLEITILFITQQGKEDTKGGVQTPMGSKKGGHEASQIWYIHKLKPKYDEAGEDEHKEKRLFEISKNKQNGRHFKTEVALNPVTLDFHAKYNKEPKETLYEHKPKEANTQEAIPTFYETIEATII
jgi:DNA repair protein RadA/Sms